MWDVKGWSSAAAGTRYHGIAQYGEDVCLGGRGRARQVRRERPVEHIVSGVIGMTVQQLALQTNWYL